MKHTNKYIFLDIDGVLYPCRNRKSFKKEAIEIQQKLEKEHNTSFQEINPYDIMCVYEGWNQNAIQLLKDLIIETEAKIILSSSWKFKFKEEILYKLFSIHHLDQYIIDVIPNSYGILKRKSISLYLEKHPEIKEYIILDDSSMISTFKHRFVYCPDVFTKEAYHKAKKILKK